VAPSSPSARDAVNAQNLPDLRHRGLRSDGDNFFGHRILDLELVGQFLELGDLFAFILAHTLLLFLF
jgi:hypothetical protein